MAIIWSYKFDLSSNMNNIYRHREYCMYIYIDTCIFACIPSLAANMINNRSIWIWIISVAWVGQLYMGICMDISAVAIYSLEDMIDMHVRVYCCVSTCTRYYCLFFIFEFKSCPSQWYLYTGMLHRYLYVNVLCVRLIWIRIMPMIGIALGSDFGMIVSKGEWGYAISRSLTTMWHWYLLVMKGTQ